MPSGNSRQIGKSKRSSTSGRSSGAEHEMRIDSDLQPLGPERMLQRLQEFQAQVGASGLPPFQLGGGVAGLSGNLPGAGLAPFDPKVAGISISSDQASPQLKSLI